MKSPLIRKLLLVIPLFSVCCFLLRCYQLREELLFDGSLTPDAFMHRVLPLVSLCTALGTGLCVYGLKKLTKHHECFSSSPLPNILMMLAAGGLLAGNLLLLLNGSQPVSQYTVVSDILTRILPYVGLLAAVCLFSFAWLCMQGRKPSALFFMAVSVYLVIRLIVCFQAWNTDPSVHDYAYQLLAAICSMLGCFQLGGFGFDKGKRRITIFWCLCAAFFCSITAADLLENLTELVINLSLLLCCATSGVQLLLAKETCDAPAENTPVPNSPAEPKDTP